MAKSINEINALNSLNKVQVLPEVKKTQAWRRRPTR